MSFAKKISLGCPSSYVVFGQHIAHTPQGILHEFSENLLVPCSYPNPMPSLAQCRLPVPPLPSHYPPHAIYNFCASLHSLMLLVEPPSEGLPGQREERWALMQKTPSNGQAGLLGGEWFTAPVDIRAAEKARKRLNKDQDGVQGGLLEVFAANGDNFGWWDVRYRLRILTRSLRTGHCCFHVSRRVEQQ